MRKTISAGDSAELIKSIIRQYLIRQKYSVSGYDTDSLTERLYEDMAGYSFLRKWIYREGVEEININAYNDIEVILSGGRSMKIPEKFASPTQAIDAPYADLLPADHEAFRTYRIQGGELVTAVLLVMLTAAFAGIACYNFICVGRDIPTGQTSKMMILSGRREGTRKENLGDVYIARVAELFSSFIHPDPLKRAHLETSPESK